MSQDYYWRLDSDAPFAALLRIVDTYCHPEAGGEESYEELIDLARHTDEFEEMRRFKEELRRALLGDRPPENALYVAAQFGDGSDEAFLRRLWHDLYPNEPLPHS